jgi:adenylate kinase
VANPGTRVVLLGKQGAGKGTQASRLSQRYEVPHLATGDIFRAAIRSGSAAGLQVKAYVEAGELVPNDVVIGVVQEALAEGGPAQRAGFILDGFPRTVPQAEALEKILAPRTLDVVIDLAIATEAVLPRLESRRVCVDCGAVYNAIDNRPQVDGVCDRCGGRVVQREDDTAAAIRRRLALYEHETAPLVAWYRDAGLIETVDADGTPDEVTARLVDVIERRLGSVEQ